MRGLAGKRVLISGGSSGIGLAAARRFLEEGSRVFLAGLDPAEVAEAIASLRATTGAPAGGAPVTDSGAAASGGPVTDSGAAVGGWPAAGGAAPGGGPVADSGAAAGGDGVAGASGVLHRQVDGMACDVSREDEAARLVAAASAALGGIDVLANNAGTARRDAFLDIAVADWDRIIAVNLRGMFLVAQAASKVMAGQGGGAIINMSSTNGIAGEEDYAHYNASKGGVLLLTKTMAVELGSMGIRVNALCPGYIKTPLNAAISAGIGGDEFEQEYIRQRIPLGRTGSPEEVAAAYAFLASDDASFIHGTGLVIDGGQLAVM